jgi:uncharacterized small protein (DUF1192 family)
MRTIFSALLLIFALSFVSYADAEKVFDEKRIQQIRQEIARLEAQCVPGKGTSRKEVEKKFGVGRPTFPGKVPPKEGVPENSSQRSYTFASLGTLIVSYDKQWKVSSAGFVDPFSMKGRLAGTRIPIEDQRRDVEPRLEQMKQIVKECNRRFKKQ